MTMIELGELSAAGPDPDDRPGPGPGIERRFLRKAALAVSLALCLLGVTASARPEQRALRPLWDIPIAEADGTTITEDSVYVSRMRYTSGAVVTAYDLRTGAKRWERENPVWGSYVQEVPGSGLLLMPESTRSIPVEPGGEILGASEYTVSTMAIDARTGREVWVAPGDLQAVGHESALMADYNERGGIGRLRLIRLADHRTVWSRDTPDLQNQAIDAPGGVAERIVTVDSAGDVVVTRFADGRTLATGRIPWVEARPEVGSFNDVAVTGDHLTVTHARGDRIGLTVYRIDTLAEAWRLDNLSGYPNQCGKLICISQSSQVVAYDPATGRKLWQANGGSSMWMPYSGRLVLENSEQGGDLQLADASTGALIGAPVRGTTIWDTDAADALLVLMPTVDPPNLTSVVRWDLDSGRTTMLGAVPKLVEYRCESVSGYLACVWDGRFQMIAVG